MSLMSPPKPGTFLNHCQCFSLNPGGQQSLHQNGSMLAGCGAHSPTFRVHLPKPLVMTVKTQRKLRLFYFSVTTRDCDTHCALFRGQKTELRRKVLEHDFPLNPFLFL